MFFEEETIDSSNLSGCVCVGGGEELEEEDEQYSHGYADEAAPVASLAEVEPDELGGFRQRGENRDAFMRRRARSPRGAPRGPEGLGGNQGDDELSDVPSDSDAEDSNDNPILV